MNARRYPEALGVLDGMNNRDAQWYYLSAVANANMGNNLIARDQVNQAVNMEPNNQQYRRLLNQLEWSGQRYQNNPYGAGYGRNTIPVEQEMRAAIFGLQIRFVNVWEAIFVHACKS